MKIKQSEKETLNCVRHRDRKAVLWTGFVIDEKTGSELLAGWCSGHCADEGHSFHGYIK